MSTRYNRAKCRICGEPVIHGTGKLYLGRIVHLECKLAHEQHMKQKEIERTWGSKRKEQALNHASSLSRSTHRCIPICATGG